MFDPVFTYYQDDISFGLVPLSKCVCVPIQWFSGGLLQHCNRWHILGRNVWEGRCCVHYGGTVLGTRSEQGMLMSQYDTYPTICLLSSLIFLLRSALQSRIHTFRTCGGICCKAYLLVSLFCAGCRFILQPALALWLLWSGPTCLLSWTAACCQHPKHQAQWKKTFHAHRLSPPPHHTHTQTFYRYISIGKYHIITLQNETHTLKSDYNTSFRWTSVCVCVYPL